MQEACDWIDSEISIQFIVSSDFVPRSAEIEVSILFWVVFESLLSDFWVDFYENALSLMGGSFGEYLFGRPSSLALWGNHFCVYDFFANILGFSIWFLCKFLLWWFFSSFRESLSCWVEFRIRKHLSKDCLLYWESLQEMTFYLIYF